MGVNETGMGNVGDKILKHHLTADKTPGTEDLSTIAWSGDRGLTLVEMGPFGVIGAITPATNPSETVICNSFSGRKDCRYNAGAACCYQKRYCRVLHHDRARVHRGHFHRRIKF